MKCKRVAGISKKCITRRGLRNRARFKSAMFPITSFTTYPISIVDKDMQISFTHNPFRNGKLDMDIELIKSISDSIAIMPTPLSLKATRRV